MNELLKLLESRKIKNNLAKRTLEEMLLTGKKVNEILSEEDLKGIDENDLRKVCDEAIKSNEKAVEDYKNGKKKAAKSLVGFVMKKTSGRADAVLAEKIIVELLEQLS